MTPADGAVQSELGWPASGADTVFLNRQKAPAGSCCGPRMVYELARDQN
jgi:hypothetical protein